MLLALLCVHVANASQQRKAATLRNAEGEVMAYDIVGGRRVGARGARSISPARTHHRGDHKYSLV